MLATGDAARVGAGAGTDRLGRADLGRWLAQVEQVGHCARPIRLSAARDTINPVTGEFCPRTARARSRTG